MLSQPHTFLATSAAEGDTSLYQFRRPQQASDLIDAVLFAHKNIPLKSSRPRNTSAFQSTGGPAAKIFR
jgi:hypothetical protein